MPFVMATYEMVSGTRVVWSLEGQYTEVIANADREDVSAMVHRQVEPLLLVQRNWTPPERAESGADAGYSFYHLGVDQPMAFHEVVTSLNIQMVSDGGTGAWCDEHGRRPDTQLVRIHNSGATELHLYWAHSRTHLATLRCQELVELDFAAPLRPVAARPFVVPATIPAFYVEATLYRKQDKGCYTLSEWVSLPQGTYDTLEELADALNSTSHMRGERNGPVYVFVASKRAPVLRLCAHHRQPHPSNVHIWPASVAVGAQLGMPKDLVMVLGNKKYVDLLTPPASLIADERAFDIAADDDADKENAVPCNT